MNDERDLPVLIWAISCFDRRRENPLPVYDRWYWLDWAQLAPEQVAEILAIVDASKRNESSHKPVGFEETVVTMSVGSPNYDSHLLKYRELFTEIPGNDLQAFSTDPLRHDRGFQTISVDTEYFEDETGTPISKYEMLQHVSGQEFPIIVGDPETVLKLGPVSAVNIRDWTTQRANTIAQFLDVVERIHASEWYRSPRFVTSLIHKRAGESRLLEAEFPDDEDTMSVLAYFRQLHAVDKLVTKACEAYIAHAGDDRKRWWVNERERSFESLIDAPPAPFNTNGQTRRQIIRMFMYGAGLLHSSSNHGDDAALDAFISHHGKYQAVMIFNSCLMDFFRVAVTIYPVIRQDYYYWINDDGLASASRTSIPDLFQGFTSPPYGA
ncbi:hypothetical protein [Rubinisphaera margarita]|uniref:hypothetical protein n=1 Tax=Rubinisphaera margarita TaxID=2909586 RepID=UPI001EE8FB9D|nr:hypothetical protein [Rubinisphaera margarita]MCG6157504.1 hypothetical protein [Rubinisphaera margarita]